uniref:Reverse transcriptase Ty1/copia-type domain-containing protein n=1 Tax=Solanum lycopersicum TaxID=4081 RepID=A0A3Q7I6E7_SOLLC
MIITRNNDDEVARLQEEFALRFDIKKLGESHHFLVLEITNTSKGVFVVQEGYAKKLVDKFGMKQSKMFSTPLKTSMRLRCEEDSLLVDPKSYRALVGSLLYLTITTKRILKYSNLTSDMDLFLKEKMA